MREAFTSDEGAAVESDGVTLVPTSPSKIPAKKSVRPGFTERRQSVSRS
jgi:hypothetical protein